MKTENIYGSFKAGPITKPAANQNHNPRQQQKGAVAHFRVDSPLEDVMDDNMG